MTKTEVLDLLKENRDAPGEANWQAVGDRTGGLTSFGIGLTKLVRTESKIVWHYGWDRANSSLIIKVPEREVAFGLQGNSEGLSRKFDLGRDEDVTRSPFAREFLRTIGL